MLHTVCAFPRSPTTLQIASSNVASRVMIHYTKYKGNDKLYAHAHMQSERIRVTNCVLHSAVVDFVVIIINIIINVTASRITRIIEPTTQRETTSMDTRIAFEQHSKSIRRRASIVVVVRTIWNTVLRNVMRP